ncbi:hypothetical protein FACS1894110_18540 [Spirochaetia bacterium]|nr:hypothetical protein FACS1894110_18540 [Spirochaetia bacterium]
MIGYIMPKKVADVSIFSTIFKLLTNALFRPSIVRCVKSIFYNFFFRQYRAALFPGKIPVSRVDHELDKKIPFTPAWMGVYGEFTAFWIRSIGFLWEELGERTADAARDFLDSMGALYCFAAEVYQKNLSTTRRPRYLRRPGFILVHVFDPHLMCIPSLHVMVVIRTYTKFAAILRSLGEEERYAPQIAELKKGARDITEAILYVKQHSVNCIAAAMYAMTCFDPVLFPPSEAEEFVSRLFTEPVLGEPPLVDQQDGEIIRKYIENLYRHFLSERPAGEAWDMPLMNFLMSRQR